MQKRALARHAADCGAMVVIEVAMDGDSARFRERDRLFDLPPFEVTLIDHGRASEQMGLYAHIAHGRRAFSGPSAKSPAVIRRDTASTLASTAASSRVTSMTFDRRRS